MNEAKFQTLARRAKLLTSDYGAGYLTGLRRHYHGESFGDPQELGALAAAGLDGDPRAELGRGYRDGLAGAEPQPLTGRPPLAPELRAEPTHPRSVRLTDAEWSELQRRGVRGAGSLAEWLADQASDQQAPR